VATLAMALHGQEACYPLRFSGTAMDCLPLSTMRALGGAGLQTLQDEHLLRPPRR